jgi:ketosteroid isomerase-like protein
MWSVTSDTPAADGDAIALLRRIWKARATGDLSVLEAALAPDAKWRAIDDGPWNCENRADIMRVMRQNLAHGLDGRIEETIPHGERIVVAFRPSEAWHGDRPLDDGIAYVVVTVHDGAITELKGCATRASAEDYATTGRTSAPHLNRVRPPDTAVSPPPQRVSRLIPFVHVTDVERSVAWYGHLGFVVTEVFTPAGRLNWANLVSGDAELMLQRAFSRVIDPGAIVLWLYSHDLGALREQLVAAGISAG